MKIFNAAEFSVRDETFVIGYMFNHAVGSDSPTPPSKSKKNYVEDGRNKTIQNLFGYRGKVGCFSAVKLVNGEIDIAIYSCAPEDVDVHEVTNAVYFNVSNQPGWGYLAVEKLKEQLRVINES